MAKIAKVGYGSDGRGMGNTQEGYTYVVNDSVRYGMKLQVIATNHKSLKKFVTTAVPKHIYGQNTAKGQEAKTEAQQNTGKDPTETYTAKELGVSASRRKDLPPLEGQKSQSAYVMQTRAGNVAKYLEKNPNAELTKNAYETYESYSKQFTKKGEQD